MARKQYGTILDEIEDQLGETQFKASFNNESISFKGSRSLVDLDPEKYSPSNLNVLRNTQGLMDAKPKPSDKQFNDSNKQLQLSPSSTIQAAAYWPNKEYLIVNFKSGHTYSYDNVPLQTVIIWEWATSAGSWFYYNIRTSYPYKKLG